MRKVCHLMAPAVGLGLVLAAAVQTQAMAQPTTSKSQLSLLLRLQPELVYVNGSAAEAAGTDGFEITDGWAGGRRNGSNWGALFIDGSHPINGDVRAFARFGLNINMDGLADGSSRTREAYAGIEGNFGKIYAGKIGSAYKTAGLSWDPFNASFLQARGNVGRSATAFGHSSAFERAVGYEQSWGGVKFRAVGSFDESVAGEVGNDDDHMISASITAPTGPIEWMAAYIDGSGYEGGLDDREAIKVGARYSQGQWSAAIMHEARMEGLEDGNFTFVTGTYRQNQWQFSANAGLFDDDNGINDGDYFALVARYQLHRLVSVHGGIRQRDRDVTGKERIAGLGLRILLNSGNLLK